jgi:nitroreductase
VAEVLELPAHARPEFMLQLGHPAPEKRILPPGPKRRRTAADLAYWESYGERREPELSDR